MAPATSREIGAHRPACMAGGTACGISETAADHRLDRGQAERFVEVDQVQQAVANRVTSTSRAVRPSASSASPVPTARSHAVASATPPARAGLSAQRRTFSPLRDGHASQNCHVPSLDARPTGPIVPAATRLDERDGRKLDRRPSPNGRRKPGAAPPPYAPSGRAFLDRACSFQLYRRVATGRSVASTWVYQHSPPGPASQASRARLLRRSLIADKSHKEDRKKKTSSLKEKRAAKKAKNASKSASVIPPTGR